MRKLIIWGLAAAIVCGAFAYDFLQNRIKLYHYGAVTRGVNKHTEHALCLGILKSFARGLSKNFGFWTAPLIYYARIFTAQSTSDI